MLIGPREDVGHPTAIRGPRVVLNFLVEILRDLLKLTTRTRHHPQPMLVVGKDQVVTGGGPARGIEVPVRGMGQDLLRAAFRAPDRDLLLA